MATERKSSRAFSKRLDAATEAICPDKNRRCACHRAVASDALDAGDAKIAERIQAVVDNDLEIRLITELLSPEHGGR